MIGKDYVMNLFIGGWYYWFHNDEETAQLCWATALEVSHLSFIGDA